MTLMVYDLVQNSVDGLTRYDNRVAILTGGYVGPLPVADLDENKAGSMSESFKVKLDML
jgi:hypothetical protein